MSMRSSRIIDVATSRLVVRGGFLLFFVWICVRLLGFAAWARGVGGYVPRPEAVAGILPVGHYTSFFAWLRGGGWDALLPAGLVIILGALALSLLFKRGFCGWICPLGSIWEFAGVLGRKLLGRNLRPPHWLDITARTLRYLMAGSIVFWLASVPIDSAIAFRTLPYMWVADIKIIEGFMTPVFLGAWLLGFVLSMLFGSVWCRYACPLGGWYGAIGTMSVCAVERDEATCIHCSKCTKACHAFVDVERVKRRVAAPECDGCMDCVRVCPVPTALQAKALGRIRVPYQVWPLLVVGLWLVLYAGAKMTGHWDTTIPDATFKQVISSGVLEQRTPGGL